jgi:hypothetical protein
MNSHGRRVCRRKLLRAGQPVPFHLEPHRPPWHSLGTLPFVPGQVVKLISDEYGVRYLGLKVTVQGPGSDPNTWVVQSTRRKSPLTVQADHLEVIEDAVVVEEAA